jgi:arabinogalactan oligomer / maltooligosaccharide transport system permease protein
MNIRSNLPPEGARGVLFAVFTVLALFIGSLLLGSLITGTISGVLDAQNQPSLDAWWILVFAAVILAPLLVVFIRVFPWLVNWYYLLPALVFLLGFTVYPIVLTVNFAFTNYSAQYSGEPDSSASAVITKIGSKEIKLSEGAAKLADLRCVDPSCAGQEVTLRDPNLLSVDVKVATRRNVIESVNGDSIILKNPMNEQFQPDILLRVNNWNYINFDNFTDIFSKASVQLYPVFIWTIIFAASTVIINALAGLVLGILLNNKRLKFRNFYRTVLFLPWAVPAVISIQMWSGLFNQNFGAINRLFALFGSLPIPWLTDPLWAKLSILLVNLWLGFPYQMTATLGALATIPDELYEAAEVDGATKWEQIRFITLPLLSVAFTPLMLSSFAFNFNNFGLIYLLTGGGPAEAGNLSTARSTDILISWGYNTAFASAGGSAYGPASAIAIIVGVLTIGISIFNFSLAGVFKEARK